MNNRNRLGLLLLAATLLAHLSLEQAVAQSRQRYANLQQALFSGGQLTGSPGPRSVNWIEGGSKFSFIDGQNTIKTFSPKDQK